jgi:MFS transporter, PHS family, inorganic phosphate transporter
MVLFMTSVLLFIMGGDYQALLRRPTPFTITYALIQFFSSFGPATTKFVLASESFPTRLRGTASDFAGACARAGTVAAYIGFSVLSNRIGMNNVLLFLGPLAFFGTPITLLVPETRFHHPDVLDRQQMLASSQGIRRDSNVAATPPEEELRLDGLSVCLDSLCRMYSTDE